MFAETEYVVRHGATVISVRKSWSKAQESVDSYIRDLSRDGTRYTRTRSQTHKNGKGISNHAIYHYVGDRKGALLVITINRGS